MKTCCFIGAGFSLAAGLPLASELFTKIPKSDSRNKSRRYRKVYLDYQKWKIENPLLGAEQYLEELNDAVLTPRNTSYLDAVEYIKAVLGSPEYEEVTARAWRNQKSILRPTHCDIHIDFWKEIFYFTSDVSIITTNYDIEIERGIRNRPMKRAFGPGCHYAGFPPNKFLKGSVLTITRNGKYAYYEVYGPIPLCKLHGSINWCFEDGELVFYHDVSPAHRLRSSAAIIPPIQQKEISQWIIPVWDKAKQYIKESNLLIFCGYSLPSYDFKIQNLLIDSIVPNKQTILIIDPNASEVSKRIRDLDVANPIYCLPGLPAGIAALHNLLESDAFRFREI
jgi:hypothetical protein